MIDRFGYADATVEKTVEKVAGDPGELELGSRWVFIDLRKFSDQLLGSLSESERLNRKDFSIHPIIADWRASFSVEESDKNQNWRWCGKHGVIHLANESNGQRFVEIDAAFRQHSSGEYTLQVKDDGSLTELTLGTKPVRYHARIVLEARSSKDIQLHFLGPLMKVATDPRELAFRVLDFQISERFSHDETPTK